MKKFLLFLICGILISSEVSAIGPFPDMTPTIPGAPQICPKCTADQQALLQSTLDHAKSAIMRGDGKQLLNNVVAQGKSYAIKTAKNYAKKQIGKLFGKKDQKPIAYTRVIKKTKTDLEDTEKVAEAFKKYFLYIPSDKEDVRAAYKEKREQFIEDTTLELYITSKEMARDLQVMLSQLDLIDRCLIQGDDESCKAEDMEDYNCQQSEEKEDEMCYRRNAVMVAQIYDTIMKNNEYLVAMRAQYEAVRTLGDGVKPKEPEDKGKKVSSLSTVFESTTGYASEEVEDSELIVGRLPDSEFEFADNNTSGVETPMANSEATLNAFPALYEAEKHLTAALKSHNMKQQLPHFKDVFDNFHRAEKMHANAVENLEESQECVLGYLNQRYEDSQKVWLGNCRVAQPDGYVCHYNPEKSMSDNSESIGIYDRRCEDTDNKCYKLDPSAYNTMGGMSGWLINTYLNAKDELTDDSTPKAENYVINAVSVDNNKDRPVEPGTDAYVAENYKRQIGENGEVLLDEYLEDMRVLSQLRHDIGVVANEKINNDVMNPLENGVFGKPYKPFPLWNDQIHFYDQYIAGKYENMRNYISDAPLFKETLTLGLKINEDQDYQAQSDAAGVVMKTAAAIRQEVAELINKLLADLGDEKDERIEKIKQLLSAEDAELAAITQEFENNKAALNAQRKGLFKKLEEINIKLADANAEITKQDKVIDFAETYNAAAEKGVKDDAKYQIPENKHETNAEMFQKKINEQTAKETEAEGKRNDAVNLLNQGSSTKEDIFNAIKSIENQIENLKFNYVVTYYNSENDYSNKINKIISEYEFSQAQQAVKDAILSVTVLGEADKILEYVKSYAIAKIDEAAEQIYAMGSDETRSLYYAQNNINVLQIHKDMLDKIINPDVEDIIATVNPDEIGKALLLKYADLLSGVFSKICDSTKCYEADEDYFVALLPQERDFAGPKAPVEFSSAPMREIFSFGLEDMSYVDFIAGKEIAYDRESNALTLEKTDFTDNDAIVILLNSSLPNSGLKLPEIWKIVLARRPFVEKKLDLDAFLNHNGEESIELTRSGIYPCVISKQGDPNTVIDLVPGGDGKPAYFSTGLASDAIFPSCFSIDKSGTSYSDRDAREGLNAISVSGTSALLPTYSASELGNILEYDNVELSVVGAEGLPQTDSFGISPLYKEYGFVSFRKELLQALRVVAKVEDEKDMTAEYYMYKRMLPQNSQFADYLDKMEAEQRALDGKEQIRNQLYSPNVNDSVVVNSLYKVFAEMGYDFDREKFDLSQNDYYTQAENILNSSKEENIRQAKKILDETNFADATDQIKERYQDLKRKISLLELDSEELITISTAESLEDLAEAIKVQKTDTAVLSRAEQTKKGTSVFDDMLKRKASVYCSSYNKEFERR